jgi:alpha-glucosidase
VTAYPDWFHNKTQAYWNSQFGSFFNESTGVDIDALWIDMNEPSNFCMFPCDHPEGFAAVSEWIGSPPLANVTNVLRPIPEFPSDFQRPFFDISKRYNLDKMMGLPGRDLINPKYAINNVVGSLSNFTARTDIIHYNGLAEYDTHNLYVFFPP